MPRSTPPDQPAPAPDELVTAPDQRRQGNRRLEYAAALVVAAMLLLLLLADNPNHVEVAWVSACAATLLIAVAADWQLRRRGIRP